MSENIAETLDVEELVEDKKNEEIQEDADLILIDMGKLLKIRHSLRKVNLLKSISDELKDYQKACEDIKHLVGELNGIKGGQS